MIELWEKFIKELELTLGQAAVDRWLRPLQIVDFDAGNLYLKAEDSFQVLWFEKEIRKMANSLFLNERKRPIKIHLQAEDLPKREKTPEITKAPLYSGMPLDPSCTLDTFIASEKNTLLLKFLKELKSGCENPLYLFGKSGVGKTHLLMALANHLIKQGLNVFYTHAETFAEHVVEAIRSSNVEPLRKTYRSIDALILDDVQCLSRKSATQEEFFHTFNHLHGRGRLIILSSQLPPSRLEEIEPRLISRFEWGILFEVHPPSLNLYPLIVQRRAQTLNLNLSNQVIEQLIQTFKSSPKALLRAVDAIAMRLSKRSHFMTWEGISERLQDLISQEQMTLVTPEKIIQLTAHYFGIRSEDIFGKSQSKEISLPRQIAIFLCRNELGLPFLTIGKLFTRDHSTIMASVRLIEKKKGAEPEIARALFELKEKIRS